MTRKQREWLSDNYQRICNRVRRYKFIPPLDYNECISYVTEKLCYSITKSKSIDVFNKYLNRKIKFLILDYRKIANMPAIDINENHGTCDNNTYKDKKEHAIACCINELDSYNRKIIMLYYYENKTEQEIAKQLGVCQKTISNHLNKALKLLKPKIKQRIDDIDDMMGEL